MEIDRERIKLINRAKRIHGQMETVERSLQESRDCTDVLMLLAAVKGGINGLMAEILEDHIRYHVVAPGADPNSNESLAAEQLVDIVKSYLR